jgi:hypothetical protein
MSRNDDKIQNLLKSSSQPHLSIKDLFSQQNKVMNEDMLMPTYNKKITRMETRRISVLELSNTVAPVFKTTDNIYSEVRKSIKKSITNDFWQAKPLSDVGVIYQAIMKNKNETLNNINTGKRRDVFACLNNSSKGIGDCFIFRVPWIRDTAKESFSEKSM